MAQGGRKVGRVIMARRGAVDDVVFVVFIVVVLVGLTGDVLLLVVLIPFTLSAYYYYSLLGQRSWTGRWRHIFLRMGWKKIRFVGMRVERQWRINNANNACWKLFFGLDRISWSRLMFAGFMLGLGLL